jgi:peptide chain release factor 2
MDQILSELKRLLKEINELMARLEIGARLAEIEELERNTTRDGFWDDPQRAQQTMQRLSKLRALTQIWVVTRQEILDTLELAEMKDESLLEALAEETAALAHTTEELGTKAMLSGPYDVENAILAIHAGAGGVDAQDWAQMLERLYLRWIEQSGYKAEILDRSDGDEAGLKSVTISVTGTYAYGYLQSEQGVHRLVRLSPFDSANRRHTSFAKVELWPDIGSEIELEINEKDLRIDTYRASGAGGQHVQKNDTAVRITHLPSGIVVQCQNQRSQAQNRERALQILKARLIEQEQKKQVQELAELKGENVSAEWGQQIRSYVLHPYQMVKDHRTNQEVGNTQSVLDGNINPFIDAFLRANLQS